LFYDRWKPPLVIADLAQEYAGVDQELISSNEWEEESDNNLGIVFTTLIANPTGVDILVNEIIEQAALVVWWDDINEQIRLQVLKALVIQDYTFGQSNIIWPSLQITEQPNKRYSQIWTYYGQVDPLTSLTDQRNYRSCVLSVDLQNEFNYQSASIKKIFSRWIAALGSAVASRLNALILSRRLMPPRKFTFDVMRYNNPVDIDLAGTFYATSDLMVDDIGNHYNAPFQIVSLTPNAGTYHIEGEEILYLQFDGGGGVDPDVNVLTIDTDMFNVNINEEYLNIYPPVESGQRILIIVRSNVIVASNWWGGPAIEMGDNWGPDPDIEVQVDGLVQGAGGAGGQGTRRTTSLNGAGNDGQDGSMALRTRVPIRLTGSGRIRGGGGGGGAGAAPQFNAGGGGGGGGAGRIVGPGAPTPYDVDNGGTPGQDGSLDAGGAFGRTYPPGSFQNISRGGNGGGPGAAGNPGLPGQAPQGSTDPGAGGAAGPSIDGHSFVDYAWSGSLAGPQVN
jgi:hypothetical protein